MLEEPAAPAAEVARSLSASPEAMSAELRAFITAVLVAEEADERSRVALDVFNTPATEGLSLADTVGEVLANPLNAVAPVIHAAGPPGRPLFIVHGADGETGWFLRHLRAAPLPRPVYGLTSPAWYGEPMPGSLRALAARHLRALREVQPAGPYTLGGFSAGAVVALEMAGQLERAGERVDAMLLIDPGLSRTPWSTAEVVHFRLNQLRKRRHPVMAPYFALADRVAQEDVLAALAGMAAIPADPVSRRFYRGLLALLGVLSAPSLSLRPVHPRRCLTLTGQIAQPANGDAGPAGRPQSSLIGCPVDVVTVPGPHARLFEQPVLHESVARFLTA